MANGFRYKAQRTGIANSPKTLKGTSELLVISEQAD